MEITSLTNAHVKQWVKYKEKKYRDQDQMFLIEGEHLIHEAHQAQLIEYLIIRKGEIPYVNGYECYEVTEEILKKIKMNVSMSQQMAVCHYPLQNQITSERIIALDDVQDPGNAGTMIRSALSFGYQGMLLSDHSVDVYNDKVIRATQGAVFHLPIRRCDLYQELVYLKKKGYALYGTSLVNAQPLSQIMPKSKHVLIMGNEGQGVREDILALCDHNIKIEMDTFESLNVAVAASICMYTLRHR